MPGPGVREVEVVTKQGKNSGSRWETAFLESVDEDEGEK